MAATRKTEKKEVHRIVVSSGIGDVNWTPPRPVQDMLNDMSKNDAEKVKKWLSRMLSGYLIALFEALINPERAVHMQVLTSGLIHGVADRARTYAIPRDRLN